MIRKNLSIIIPSYRRKKILQEILGVLTKNFRELDFDDYEILVVESGDIEEKELEYFSDQEYVICPSGIQSLPDIFKKIKSGNNFNKMVFGIFI